MKRAKTGGGTVIVAMTLALLMPEASATARQIDTLALRGHTYVLAHDELEGRGTGTRGERAAAAYIVGQLKRLGIPGAMPGGAYLQPIPLKAATIVPDGTRLTVSAGARTTELRFPADFVLDRASTAALGGFSGRASFAGTAATAPSALDGTERLDGQVVVLLGGLGLDAVSLLPELARRGAEAVVLLVTEESAFDRLAAARANDPLLFVDATIDEPYWQPPLPVLYAGPRAASALLAGVAIDPDRLAGRAPFAALDLERSLSLELNVALRDVPSANVAALVYGSDPALRDEVVIYTAHYDHLGIGQPDTRGDSIFNGFSDNAAGVAMLLAIAETLVRDPPARSVLFLFPSAEEQGLLGSSYYATRPPIPLERTVAVINLDGGAPPAPPTGWWAGGGDLSTLGELARRAGAPYGWEVRPTDARPNSDHWPFLRRGVPAIFLVPGNELEGVGARERERLHQQWGAYHQPSDRWHPDFPFAGLARYALLALEIGRAAANARQRPRWLGEEPQPP